MTSKEKMTYLENAYRAQSNDVFIVYGMPRVGVKDFLFDFVKDKNCFYYKSRPCDISMQIGYLAKQLSETVKNPGMYVDDFGKLFKNYIISSEEKKVIILDDFLFMSKDNPTFLSYLISILRNQLPSNRVLIILSTTNVEFIEEQMLDHFGKSVYEIKGILKIEPLSLSDYFKKYKSMSFNDFVSIYSCIGGNKELWEYVDAKMNYKDFIQDVLISRNGLYSKYEALLLPADLRETSVYNTLLAILSEGNVKLNTIHEKTGFDRAKIAVYMKNLSKRGIVCKAEADDELCKLPGSKKGTYTICDPFLRFYYKYIFTNMSMAQVLSPDRFFRRYIEPSFLAYREEMYITLALQYLQKMSSDDVPGVGNYRFARFYDKNDAVDIVGQSQDGQTILCGCRFAPPHMAYSRLESIFESAKTSKLKYNGVYLISANDFDQKLHLYSSVHDNVKLINFSELA